MAADFVVIGYADNNKIKPPKQPRTVGAKGHKQKSLQPTSKKFR
jgi:hypothetical protein